jgi:hypothetical protein
MSDEIMETVEQAETETAAVETQGKTFSQEELDRIVADRIAREQRKFEKKLNGINLDEARDLLEQREQAELEAKKQRGEFDAILKQTVEKKEAEINSYKSRLQETLIDGALVASASRNNAVDSAQVTQLLKGNTRLNADGVVEIVDSNGTPRYNDKGELLTVDEMVGEFLTANPHFVKATPGGAGTLGKAGGNTSQPDKSMAWIVDNWNDGGKEMYAKLKGSQR